VCERVTHRARERILCDIKSIKQRETSDNKHATRTHTHIIHTKATNTHTHTHMLTHAHTHTHTYTHTYFNTGPLRLKKTVINTVKMKAAMEDMTAMEKSEARFCSIVP